MTGRDPAVPCVWAHCAALKAAVLRLLGPVSRARIRGEPDGLPRGGPCRRRIGSMSTLENSIASASIVSASCKGHPVDALALEAEEGRCRLR